MVVMVVVMMMMMMIIDVLTAIFPGKPRLASCPVELSRF